MDLYDRCDAIKTRQDFIDFIYALINDEKAVAALITEDTLSYMGTVAGYAGSIQNAYANRGEVFVEEPSWRLFATLLHVAMTYE